MNIRFLTVAQKELDDTVAWYESQQTTLSLRFLDEVDKAIKRIVVYPDSCTEIETNILGFRLLQNGV